MPVLEATASELVEKCIHSGSEEAWQEFVRRFQPLVASVVLRICRRYGNEHASAADDLVQETFLRLCRDNCKALRRFEFRHEAAIFGYVKVVAASAANDHFRFQGAQKRGDEEAVDPEVLARKAVAPQSNEETRILFKEMEHSLHRSEITERDRNVFWLYYKQGFTAAEIALKPGIGLSAKGVESCLLRLVKVLRAEMLPKSPQIAGKQRASTLGEVR